MSSSFRSTRRTAAFCGLAALLAGCAGGEAAHDGHGVVAAAAPVSDFSLYDLDGVWQNQRAERMELSGLSGRPQVIALVYTSCAYACPRIVADMKRIEAELPGAGFVLVSIDPERDTPDRLAAFAAAARIDNWTLLTGDAEDIMELAATLGVRQRRVSETDFEHSNIITLVDREGRIVHQQVGLGADPQPLVAAAPGLTNPTAAVQR